MEAFGYVAHTVVPDGAEPDPAELPEAIARYVALDGRSFERDFQEVLAPQLDWEDGTVGAPSALRVADQIWLYYEAAGGIGLAQSSDGVVFQRQAEPVLAAALDGWDQGAAPQSPVVVADPDGGFRMFYESRRTAEEAWIGEAVSEDGVRWRRIGPGPALTPRAGEPAEFAYDDGSVEAPHALFRPSAKGRMILWLYYAAVDRSGRRTIGVAARSRPDEPFRRAVAPVFGTTGSLGPSEPWVISHESFALLFVSQRAGRTESQDYPAVAAGVAPATAILPPPVTD